MTFRDCYRLTLHSIKENKARSILTVIISTFLSTLIMGMMALAVSFSKNSDNIINKAYFSDDAIVTVNYQNSRVQAVEDQEVFTKKYLDSFYKVINDYSDMVQFIQYETNVLSTFNFVDSKYSQEVGINIVEGRNIEPSEKGNEVIVSKAFYLKSLEDEDIEDHTIGSVHTSKVQYRKVVNIRSTEQHELNLEYVVVGIYDYPEEQSVVINGEKRFVAYNNLIADINTLLNLDTDDIYISAFTISHFTNGKVNSPKKVINRFNSLKTALNKLLPQAVSVEYFQGLGGGIELIKHYSDGAKCNVYEKYAENDAIRFIVIAIAIFFAIILLLMSIGSLANSVLISIERSKKFIGLLKALGMRGRSLKSIVIFESITLISVGVIMGYLLLFTLYTPLTSLINTIIGSTYSSYLKVTAYVSSIYIPIYILLGALFAFILLTYLFSRGSLHKIAKTDPMAVISEVS